LKAKGKGMNNRPEINLGAIRGGASMGRHLASKK
jgi:hypothetical protein